MRVLCLPLLFLMTVALVLLAFFPLSSVIKIADNWLKNLYEVIEIILQAIQVGKGNIGAPAVMRHEEA